jgi:hypothetical protein
MWKDEVQPPSRPSHFSVWHLSLRNSFTSSKQCCVFSFAQMFHSYGRAYHTYNHDLSLSTNTTYTEGFYFIVMLFLYYCMVFNQIVHSLVKEPLHILARRLSLRNAIIIGILHLHPLFFQKCVTILKEILQKVMLYRTFPHFRMQYCIHSGTFWNSNFIEILPASVEAFYAKAMLNFLEGMPHHV